MKACGGERGEIISVIVLCLPFFFFGPVVVRCPVGSFCAIPIPLLTCFF